ncbi:OmpA family protein [Pseudomonas sp. SCB32]|uniref:OmpA family protein n=1 Tax=Pseudomonas sp. SCB32 TaxID=2653853 RepID=UPI001264BB28|nr:type VI secretion system ImpA family N-terminal domain-containing protein [Pseudomonas sp. SCB32]
MLISDFGMRLGGDPRGFAEYRALRDELLKLSHPARPDVDWAQVENLCLALQEENGLELQSMVVLILARVHLYALPGLQEGIQSLNRRLPQLWDQLWPSALSARLESLSWAFEQLQPLLRTVNVTAESLPRLQQLNEELDSLADLLLQYAEVPLISLQALRRQLGRVAARLNREAILGDLLVQPKQARVYASATVTATSVGGSGTGHTPEVIVVTVAPEPPVSPAPLQARRSPWLWLLLVIALAAALGFGYWQWHLVSEEQTSPRPIQLDSLLLFPPGSTKLRPEATKVLINGLMNIKAQPNWLIVITGHSDSSGDSTKNLEISRARAMAVKEWMQQMGDIPDSCFVVQGYGADLPLMNNDSEAGRAANRRVDVRLIPQGGACNLTTRP